MLYLDSINSYFSKHEMKKRFSWMHVSNFSINNRDFSIDKRKYSYKNFQRDSNPNYKKYICYSLMIIFSLIPLNYNLNLILSNLNVLITLQNVFFTSNDNLSLSERETCIDRYMEE